MSLELELQASLQNLEPKYEQKINTTYHQIGVNGDQISMLGIEDFYGNLVSFVDGFYAKDDGYYITENPIDFGEIIRHKYYECIPTFGSNLNEHQSGYIKNIQKINYYNIPKDIISESSKYYANYTYSKKNGQINIAKFGGSYSHPSSCSIFFLDLPATEPQLSYTVSSRLTFLP